MLRGFVDGQYGDHVGGWAFNSSAPDEHLRIELQYQGRLLTAGVAANFREDLQKAGIGAGDHGFFIKLPGEMASLEGVVVVARSAAHGETTLPIATDEDRMAHELFDAVAARYDQAISRLTAECDRLRERLDSIRPPSSNVSGTPGDLEKRLAAIESRLEAAEVFFVRIDETVRRLSEENKQRRRRFLGIF